jgi:hypothetical protein
LEQLGGRQAIPVADELITLKNYFLNLGFYPAVVELGGDIQSKRILWTLMSYLVLSSGIFCRQCISLSPPPLNFQTGNLHGSVMAASFILGLALLPPCMRWLNRKRIEPNWEQVLWSFSFGFFVDTSASFVWKHLL